MSTQELRFGQAAPGSGRLLFLGIAFLSLGVAALIFPTLSTLAVAAFVGLALIVSGAILLFESFTLHGAGSVVSTMFASLLSLAAGVFLLASPAAGSALLTLMVGVTLLLQGFIEFVIAGEYRRMGSAWVLGFSALASVVIAVLIFAGWPSNSRIVLGVLIGINFLTSGVAYIAISRALRRSM